MFYTAKMKNTKKNIKNIIKAFDNSLGAIDRWVLLKRKG